MSDGIQITIPDFDDDNDYSTPVFGRTAGGGLWGNTNSGLESPTTSTPLADRGERSYFHSRGDSVASEDSSISTHQSTRKFKPPFAHSAQSSVATTSSNSPFSKKPSFASLRNAFKSTKSSEPAPPLPPINHEAYPVLKNPFNRSTSSLAHVQGRPSIHASSPQFRPNTPSSADMKPRAGAFKSKGHTPAKSQHSHSGSIFHSSDTGSEHGFGMPYVPSLSPPPVPTIPSRLGGMPQHEELDIDDHIIVEARTPSDFALHAIFIRFAAAAEALINEFVSQPVEHEPYLETFMGPGVDPKLDELLQALGKIAEKHAKPVVESVLRWEKSQNDSSVGMQRTNVARPGALNPVSERRALAAIYIACRALVAATQSISKDSLSDAVGTRLEQLAFARFKNQDRAVSPNHRANIDLYARLLGNLADIRFESVTDRFRVELGPVAAGHVSKDSDAKYEHLVKGLRYVQIKVWPPEFFEEGAEFMDSLSRSFDKAHGNRLKTVFSEILIHMLYSIGKTAQAEVNHPQWAKAMEIIYPKAKDMASKPRYWQVAFPLAVTSLCVAPRDYFQRNWQACLEYMLSKYKEKSTRTPIMNGILRLVWTYLFRCPEPGSTVTMKMEALMKSFFPANRPAVAPAEDGVELLVYLVHFVLMRNFDYGNELCLELLQEKAINASQSSQVTSHLAPDKMAIAVQAILLSVRLVEKEEPIPVWPTSSDFLEIPSREDYPSSSDFLPPDLLKPNWNELLERCGACLSIVATASYNAVGRMSVLDDQWSASKLNPSYEETHNFVVRHNPEGAFAYPSTLYAQIHVLQLCYQSWPRCPHPSLSLEEVLEMLVHGLVHVEPSICDAAFAALERFTFDLQHASALVTRLCIVVFDPQSISGDGSSLRLMVEVPRVVQLWNSAIDKWADHLIQRQQHTFTEAEAQGIVAQMDSVEAAALFMLSHMRRTVTASGSKTLRSLAALRSHFFGEPSNSPTMGNDSYMAIDILLGRTSRSFMDGLEDVLDPEELPRLRQWRNSDKPDFLLRILESDDNADRALWKHLFPALLQTAIDDNSSVLSAFRDKLVSAITRYNPTMLRLSGLGGRPGLPSRTGSIGDRETSKLVLEQRFAIQQWHMWAKLVCAIAQVGESRPGMAMRDHSRARSEFKIEREGFSSSRDLFKYLSTFLDSDLTVFRDAAVSCISSFPPYGYSQLLEDLSILASRQLYDDVRTKGSSVPAVGRARRQERFNTAVARIYYLTAHLLKQQRSSGKQASLAHILKYIRNMQAFLSTTENRDSFSLQRLRRYFCGTLERIFDGLAALNDIDRFIPRGMYLSLYRLCEEWCQLGKQSEVVKKRLVTMQTAAATSYQDPAGQAELIQRFQTETRALSNAAVGAMASLIQKAYFPPEVSASGSPTDKPLEQLKALDASQTLDRLVAILASFTESVQNYGKKALRSLLLHSPYDNFFADEVLRRAFVTARDLSTSNARFFEVVADAICTGDHGFSFSQVVCLGLSNLCHPILDIRRRAFNILETIHEQCNGIISLAQHETAVGSHAPSAYLYAHRSISDILSGEHPEQAGNVLSQFADWIPRVYDGRREGGPLILLQSLEYWVPSINLMSPDRTGLTREGHSAIYHLISLTVRYAESHAEQVLVLWTKLVEAPYQSNGHAVIRFLVEQSPKVGSTLFVSCAAKIVACLAQSVVGNHVLQELCDILIPRAMLPALEHKLGIPEAEDLELWSDLDILFPDQPRLPLGMAQFALLFLSEGPMERCWEMREQLPVLLHLLMLHLDHREPFVHQHCRHMLSQLLRSCASGYDELLDRPLYPSRSKLKSSILELEQSLDTDKLWKEGDTTEQVEEKLRSVCSQVIDFVEPLLTTLVESWGYVALHWATTCTLKPMALRSLQIYRALSPRIDQKSVEALLGRLSNMVAEEDPSVQAFTSEVIITLHTIVSSPMFDLALMPQVFWCGAACLSTISEVEFKSVLDLMGTILVQLDLDDEQTAEVLLSERPPSWRGTASLQVPLLMGLRSSETVSGTFKMLQQLAKFTDSRIIDPSEGRLRDLYTVSIPWCLHAMTEDIKDDALQEFALDIARLADQEERPSITRIMTSFAKNRFRTKEDFLRQSVASLREHYGMDHWGEVVTLLVGLVLNKEKWLRVYTLQILKVLFQQRETKSSVDVMGSELLMPLLRLLETDLATEALEVLDIPMQISGGPAAKHVLRMSLHNHLTANAKEVESVAEIFGIAQESGWCVPRTAARRETCRWNIGAVCDLHKVSSRLSQVGFHDAVMLDQHLMAEPSDEDLGSLVQNLHELSSFFQEDQQTMAVPNRQLEARVAAILAKSTDPSMEVPQTPFHDIFDVGVSSSSDISDYTSDSDSESDLFEFDPPTR